MAAHYSDYLIANEFVIIIDLALAVSNEKGLQIIDCHNYISNILIHSRFLRSFFLNIPPLKSFSLKTFDVRISNLKIPQLVREMMLTHKRSSIAFNVHFHFAIKRGRAKVWFSCFWFLVSFQLRNKPGDIAN